jgi:hypothetical protein
MSLSTPSEKYDLTLSLPPPSLSLSISDYVNVLEETKKNMLLKFSLSDIKIVKDHVLLANMSEGM